ncbi:MAG: NADH:flavin oxidoreductase/NADH oxidase, partial [Gemmatimonadales bacterium]|nr:NADH:flavin oxidoreductase/NADH oxidase [Gemmatimonadales bacterium]
MSPGGPRLLEPIRFRNLALRNRIMVAPMAMYSANQGFVDDFHLAHLGRFALGGAGLVMAEATAVSPDARITPGCAGLWLDAHVEPWERITRMLRRCKAAAGLQLAQAGRKGSTRRPWHGGLARDRTDQQARRESSWPVVSATDAPFDEDFPLPAALDEQGLDDIVEDYRAAAGRAHAAGFDLLEIHCAHG